MGKIVIKINNQELLLCLKGKAILDKFLKIGKRKKICLTKDSYKNKTNYYARIMVNKKYVSIHRLLVNALDKQIVDHINRNTLDNRLSNLRIVDANQNARNNSQYSRKHGFKGVCLRKDRPSPWRAQIRVNNKLIVNGCYKTKEKAAMAYDEVATRYFGEYAVTNSKLGLL